MQNSGEALRPFAQDRFHGRHAPSCVAKARKKGSLPKALIALRSGSRMSKGCIRNGRHALTPEVECRRDA
jgi:hypothetical protein